MQRVGLRGINRWLKLVEAVRDTPFRAVAWLLIAVSIISLVHVQCTMLLLRTKLSATPKVTGIKHGRPMATRAYINLILTIVAVTGNCVYFVNGSRRLCVVYLKQVSRFGRVLTTAAVQSDHVPHLR